MVQNEYSVDSFFKTTGVYSVYKTISTHHVPVRLYEMPGILAMS